VTYAGMGLPTLNVVQGTSTSTRVGSSEDRVSGETAVVWLWDVFGQRPIWKGRIRGMQSCGEDVR
jgi:hypothetical protein